MNDVESEILFHISNEFDQQVDERQLINQVQAVGDGYELRAYGKTLKFNSDGDLV